MEVSGANLRLSPRSPFPPSRSARTCLSQGPQRAQRFCDACHVPLTSVGGGVPGLCGGREVFLAGGSRELGASWSRKPDTPGPQGALPEDGFLSPITEGLWGDPYSWSVGGMPGCSVVWAVVRGAQVQQPASPSACSGSSTS